MKLTATQICALADYIYEDMMAKWKKMRDEREKEEKQFVEKKLELKSNLALKEYYLSSNIYNATSRRNDVEEFIKHNKYSKEYEAQFPDVIKSPFSWDSNTDRRKIKSQIVLHTIIAKDLEEIKSKVSELWFGEIPNL